MRVMITGGGTAGHTSPAVAIVEELKKRDPRFDAQWVGRAGGIEERVAKSIGVPFRSVPVRGWPRKGIARRIVALLLLAASMARAYLYLRRFRPQVVIGVGGYVSLPLAWVAQRMGIPTVLHEQNRYLGLANRLLAPRAYKILLSFPDTVGSYPESRALVVGNPVRGRFAEAPDRKTAIAALGLDPGIPLVLVVGGSQGAHTLNQALIDALPTFHADEAQFCWMTGNADYNAAREAVAHAAAHATAHAFIDDMATACAASSLMVSRAGASSTAEIALLGKPAILVPYPHATDNHQEANARAFEDAGAARVLLDKDCSGDALSSAIREILRDPTRLEAMGEAARTLARPVAVETIIDAIFDVAFPEARQ